MHSRTRATRLLLRLALLVFLACSLEPRVRWSADSVQADFTAVRDSSIVAAQLDSMPLNSALVLTVNLVGGGHASLTWDYR